MKSFCAAPWLEAVLYNNGDFKICSRNSRSFGKWDAKPLRELWISPKLKEFREKIFEGEYPDDDCRACHLAGTSQSFARILTNPWQESIKVLWEQKLIGEEGCQGLQRGISLMEPGLPWEKVSQGLNDLRKLLDLPSSHVGWNAETRAAHGLLLRALKVLEDFHLGRPDPSVVGPFRQVQLISKCNARCAMCPGLFTGELANGTSIDEHQLVSALDSSQDILDFFCNGSELLLFKGWKQIAERLKEAGCRRLRISTNGMLLTEENVEFLLEKDVIGHLNISLNSGTESTLERVQGRVRYAKVEENVFRLFNLVERANKKFPLSFSFVLMASTLQELPDFFRTIRRWRERTNLLKPHAMILSMENAGLSNYRSFLFEEHPQWLPVERRKEIFEEAAQLSEELDIPHVLYNFGGRKSLRDLLADGYVSPFVARPEDVEAVDAKVRESLDAWYGEILYRSKEKIEETYAEELVLPLGQKVQFCDELQILAQEELRERFQKWFAWPEAWRRCFQAFPEYEERFRAYGDEYLGHCLKRLPVALEIFHREIFARKIGNCREELPEHEGERIWKAPWSRVRVGARVLFHASEVGEFLMAQQEMVYLLVKGKVQPVPMVSVRGVFLLDTKIRAEESFKEAQDQVALYLEIDSFFKKEIRDQKVEIEGSNLRAYLEAVVGASQVSLENLGLSPRAWQHFRPWDLGFHEGDLPLRPGQVVLGADLKLRVFLLPHGDSVYASEADLRFVHLVRISTLRGLFSEQDSLPLSRVWILRLKARVHRAVHRWSSQRKSLGYGPLLGRFLGRYHQLLAFRD